MVKGKPYVSVNSAIINAEKAPKLRQSVLVFGLVKLKAKKINNDYRVNEYFGYRGCNPTSSMA